jgi:hypothetical protein
MIATFIETRIVSQDTEPAVAAGNRAVLLRQCDLPGPGVPWGRRPRPVVRRSGGSGIRRLVLERRRRATWRASGARLRSELDVRALKLHKPELQRKHLTGAGTRRRARIPGQGRGGAVRRRRGHPRRRGRCADRLQARRPALRGDGPRLLTFAEAVAEIAKATGREIRYLPMSAKQYASALTEAGLPADEIAGYIERCGSSLRFPTRPWWRAASPPSTL